MATFGYATITVVSQNAVTGIQTCILEQSACLVNAAYFDDTRTAFVPNAVRYRVDSLDGQNIVPWQGIPPALNNQVTITSQQNSLLSQTRTSECHQVTFQVTDGMGNQFYATAQFDIVRCVGLG